MVSGDREGQISDDGVMPIEEGGPFNVDVTLDR
jgi:hypothetical protein